MSIMSQQARAIFAEAMRQVDVRRVTQRHLQCDGETLTLGELTIPLRELDQLLILALGKAAVPMYQAADEVLRRAFQLERHALVIAPAAPPEKMPDAAFLRGPHPTPDG